MVEAVLPNRTYEALGVGIRTRRPDGSADGVNTDRGEHLIECSGELGVPVTDEEAELPTGLLDFGGEVAGNLGHPWTVRVGGDAEDVDDAALHLDDEEHVVTAEQHRVDMEEVGSHDALGLGGEELSPRWTLSPRSRWKAMAA